MVADRDSEYSSPFDAILEKDRARLERLLRGSSPEMDRLTAAVVPAPAMPVAPTRSAVRATERREQTGPTPSRSEMSGTADGIPFSFRPSE